MRNKTGHLSEPRLCVCGGGGGVCMWVGACVCVLFVCMCFFRACVRVRVCESVCACVCFRANVYVYVCLFVLCFSKLFFCGYRSIYAIGLFLIAVKRGKLECYLYVN